MFSVRALFEALEALPTSAAIRESLYGYPLLLTGHVVSMCIFAGLIAMMDMRLLGIGFKRTPFSELQKRLFHGAVHTPQGPNFSLRGLFSFQRSGFEMFGFVGCGV